MKINQFKDNMLSQTDPFYNLLIKESHINKYNQYNVT